MFFRPERYHALIIWAKWGGNRNAHVPNGKDIYIPSLHVIKLISYLRYGVLRRITSCHHGWYLAPFHSWEPCIPSRCICYYLDQLAAAVSAVELAAASVPNVAYSPIDRECSLGFWLQLLSSFWLHHKAPGVAVGERGTRWPWNVCCALSATDSVLPE